MRMFSQLACLAATASAFAVVSQASGLYNFTSFDGPGRNGGGTTVNGINNNGAVVGFSSDAADPTLLTNFIRNPDGTFNLLSIGGDPLAMANGINNSPLVVGGFSNGTAFTDNAGLIGALPAVNGTTTSQTAFGINDENAIVGQFTDSQTGTTPGYLYVGGVYTILNPFATATVTNAQGINNNGVVTGFYSFDGVHQHGFFYNATTASFSFAPDPTVANLVLTQFLGINDQGVVVGYYQTTDGSQHGLFYNSNTHTYTFLDDPNAATSGFSITQITGINDSNEITGFYIDSQTGLQRGFVATVATPEPSSWLLALGALFSACVLRRRLAHGW